MNVEMIWPWLRRGLVGAVLVFLVLMVMDFNGRMAELTRLRAQHEVESAHIADLNATQFILQTQIAYATSEPAVAEWAREQGRLYQDGDFPIFLIPDPAYTPPPPAALTISPNQLAPWETWFAWFFGRTP
jgi:cell division protein FtsB